MPRVGGEPCSDLVRRRRLDGEHHALLVGQWPAEDDEPVVDEPVHERGVGVPPGLLLHR